MNKNQLPIQFTVNWSLYIPFLKNAEFNKVLRKKFNRLQIFIRISMTLILSLSKPFTFPFVSSTSTTIIEIPLSLKYFLRLFSNLKLKNQFFRLNHDIKKIENVFDMKILRMRVGLWDTNIHMSISMYQQPFAIKITQKLTFHEFI